LQDAHRAADGGKFESGIFVLRQGMKIIDQANVILNEKLFF
jgi:myo-inositol-hexaphosphate 3-phosphohydrolase